MVTFLDLSLFQYFNIVFPILLIFAVVFGVLHKTKILGENPTLNAVVAAALALMSLLSQDIIDLINFISPWFVLVFVFLILLLLLYQMLGATEKDIFGALKADKTIQWAVFGIAIIILIAGFGHIWGEKMLSQQGPPAVEGEGVGEAGGFQQNINKIFFSTKMLGLIFIFLIAIFAVAILAGG